MGTKLIPVTGLEDGVKFYINHEEILVIQSGTKNGTVVGSEVTFRVTDGRSNDLASCRVRESGDEIFVLAAEA